MSHPKFEKSLRTVKYCPCGKKVPFLSGRYKYCSAKCAKKAGDDAATKRRKINVFKNHGD
jgi:hypothetical protein